MNVTRLSTRGLLSTSAASAVGDTAATSTRDATSAADAASQLDQLIQSLLRGTGAETLGIVGRQGTPAFSHADAIIEAQLRA